MTIMFDYAVVSPTVVLNALDELPVVCRFVDVDEDCFEVLIPSSEPEVLACAEEILAPWV